VLFHLDNHGASNHIGGAGESRAGFVASAVKFDVSLAQRGPLQFPQKYTCPSSSRKTVGSSPQLSNGFLWLNE